MKKLEKYNKKRDFSKTNEPKGEIISSKAKNLRFVIQHHKASKDHYDFRLEHDGVLLSWAVPKGLSKNPKDKRLAVMVEDHPLDYIDFEGVIPKGNYGAGSVEIYDKGKYIPKYDIDYGLQKGHLQFELKGKKFKGEFSLVRMDRKNWLIIKSDDEFASEKVEQEDTSLPFKTCDVMLATLSNKLPTGRDWAYEIKYDGYRIVSFCEEGKIECKTRNGNDYTEKLKDIAKSLKQINEKSFVLDGEVVSFDEKGRSDFGLLQRSLKEKGEIYYVVFDILALNGKDLRKEKFLQRKQILERVLAKAPQNIIYSQHIIGKGKQCFAFAKKEKLEGVIAKKTDSVYLGNRSEDWLKIKCYKRQEFVIGGFETSEKNALLSAIYVGYYKDNKLIFAGKVGTGFDEEEKLILNKKFSKIAVKKCPFDKNFKKSEQITWLSPKLIAEIQYAELTKDGVLRQPSFIGLRDDKDAKKVFLEER